MVRARSTNEQGYVSFQSARLPTQQPGRVEALFFVLVIVAAVAATAARTSTWANSSIRLQAIDEFAGQWPGREPEHRLVGAIPAAVLPCATAQRATLADEFASLSQTIGDALGQPLECARVDPATGDVLQPTSTGLLVYRAGSHVSIFTDGYRHWALGRQGLVTWEGKAVDPPE